MKGTSFKALSDELGLPLNKGLFSELSFSNKEKEYNGFQVICSPHHSLSQTPGTSFQPRVKTHTLIH